ncbi:putative sigma factor [Citrobacter phage CVT22]|uniref:Sigma factor n=1 Tax=Citrobacter phage CVT22 TaxID=1622234 RepID=A0A0R6CA61_9CAUD|nr:RNA polymerase sigma factor [Citrobacter phage CVT22]AJT60749.1 putative sigma factor [Citrobacter phage CVT22]
MNKLQLLEEHFKENRDTMVKQANRKIGEFFGEDVVQETYARCLKYVDTLPEDAKVLNSYTYKVMRNVIKDYLSDSISSVEVEEDMLESGEMVDEWEAKGILKEIKKDILGLKSPSKEVVYCALFHGDSYEVISAINKVSIPTIWKTVSLYRKHLEEKYG